jgi:hypothetical protein
MPPTPRPNPRSRPRRATGRSRRLRANSPRLAETVARRGHHHDVAIKMPSGRLVKPRRRHKPIFCAIGAPAGRRHQEPAPAPHATLPIPSGRPVSVQDPGLPSTKVPCAQRNRNGCSALNSGQCARCSNPSRIGDRRVPCVRGIPGVVTRCCRDAWGGGRGGPGAGRRQRDRWWVLLWMGGAALRWPGLPLIQMPGIPAVTRRARAGGPGQHHGPAGTSGSAGARTRSGPARRAAPSALPGCSW